MRLLSLMLALNIWSFTLIAQKDAVVYSDFPTQNRYEKVHIPLLSGNDAEEVLSIIYKKYPCFQNPDITLRITSEKQSPGGNHLHFQQYYKDIPIYYGGIKANIHKNNYILSFMNHLENPTIEAACVFVLNEASVKGEIHQIAKAYQSESRKMLYSHLGKWIPVYVITTFAHTFPASFEWIIDARTGELVAKTDRAAYFQGIAGDTTGRGTVFRPDPLTRAQVVYGSPYVDNNDQHNAVFNPLLDTVVLKNITFNAADNRFYLEGPYVKIEDIDPFDSIPASSASGDFYFTRNRSGFEDVMVYYHIDSFQRYIQSLGFTNLYNEPLRADPHGYGSQDNSHFIPNGASSYVGWGQGGVDDAEDADVITHEYGHALSYSGSTNTNTGTERKGLDEGIGDYICSSYSYDINPFNWHKVFTWDGHNEYWGGRVSNSTQTYPVTGSIYSYGTVWASCLMEIRLAIGAEASDKNFFQELYMNVAGMTLPDAAHNFLDADSMLHNGANTLSIVNYFCNRGLFMGTDCVVDIAQPQAQIANWVIFPNPTLDKNLFIDFPPKFTDAKLEVTDITGRSLCLDNLIPGQSTALTLESGCYFMRIITPNAVSDWKKVWIQ